MRGGRKANYPQSQNVTDTARCPMLGKRHQLESGRMADLCIDFVGGAVGHRFRQSGGRHQPLHKAAGFANGVIPTVIDATAGLGRDAFLLASLGATVTMIERSPAIHDLLQDAMARARAAGPEWAAIMDRMTLLGGDAKELLPTLAADVITVDPMHPLRKNSALVKQEMRVLRQVVGADQDAFQLMQVALACARKRVVLKWPLRAAFMDGLPKPSHQIIGKTTRYDVFMRLCAGSDSTTAVDG